MTVFFTDEELEWINPIKFDWTIKKDCPKKIKVSIEKKLKLLKIPQGYPTNMKH